MRCAILLFVLLCLPALAQTHDSWRVKYQHGVRTGYSHTRTTHADGQVVSNITDDTTVRRLGELSRTEVVQQFVETEAGHPVSFTQRENQDSAMSGQLVGQKMAVEIVSGGQRSLQEDAWDEAVLFPEATSRALEKLKLEPGSRLSVRAFLPEIGLRGTTLNYEVLDRVQELWRCRVTVEGMPGLELFEYLDEGHESHRTEIPVMEILEVEGTREEAMAPLDAAALPDVMLNSGVTSNLVFYRPRQVSRARYRVTGAEPLVGDSQSLDGEGNVVVVSAPLVGQPSPDARYLRPNTYLHCTDPVVVQAAREGAGDRTGAQAVLALREYVRKVISNPSMDVAFGTDLETLANHKGDCTEYSVLLASLCRARGIPARIATGMVYADGVFMGHCWTEVELDGRWQRVDAALGGAEVDATHLKFADSSLNEPGLPTELGSMVAAMGRMKFQVVDYVEDGKAHAGGAPPRLEEGQLLWSQLGLRLRTPLNWTLGRATFPSLLVLQAPDGSRLRLANEEYEGRNFQGLAEMLGGGQAWPRVDKVVDGHRAALVVRDRDVALLVDRGDSYLSLQMLDVPPERIQDFMTIVASLQLKEP